MPSHCDAPHIGIPARLLSSLHAGGDPPPHGEQEGKMPRNAMQVGSETHACMSIHRIGGVMRGASFGIVALAATSLMPMASQADDMSMERDFSREIQMGCEAWGMASSVPDYVCIAQ